MAAAGGWAAKIMAKPEIKVYPDAQELARAAAQHFAEGAVRAVQRQGHFSVALSGGSTPRAIYALLGGDAYTGLDWSRIHIFWGDERCVPPDHPDSNYRMARESLLDHIAIPKHNIHRIKGEVRPENAGREYDHELRTFFARKGWSADFLGTQTAALRGFQTFDLILLGLGDDGHTASLFPGAPALEVTDRWAIAVDHAQPPPPLVARVSLTLPVINAAAQVTFIVSGGGKTRRLNQVLAPPQSSEPPLPAQLIQPGEGRLLWLVDKDTRG